ncbi:MAG: hypothetical protein CR984_03610, partial [Proteobacteria bacterium]
MATGTCDAIGKPEKQAKYIKKINTVSKALNNQPQQIGHLVGNELHLSTGASAIYYLISIQKWPISPIFVLYKKYPLSGGTLLSARGFMTKQGKPTSVFSMVRMAVLILCTIAMATGANGQASPTDGDTEIGYLKGLSLEDLLQTEIISASKKSEPLFDTASAVFVITQEDLRRTGARNIPEALRMVSGLQVAHIDANRWAITSRGFADWFSNKLLVMIDGRSVYTPIFSGVHWGVQDTIMADIERIEVIRGPGAVVWGANAVNGVINIITKSASETLGGMVNIGVGTHEQPLVEARYGARIGDMADVRLFAKGFRREPFNKKDGGEALDAWQNLQAGFRANWQAGSRDDFILDGRVYDGEAGSEAFLSGFLTPPYTRITEEVEKYSGGH